MSVFKALQPLMFTFFSFPLHSADLLAGDGGDHLRRVGDAVSVARVLYSASDLVRRLRRMK